MFNTVDVLDGNNQITTKTSRMMMRAFVYLLGVFCLAAFASVSGAAEKRTYLHTDHLGSVIAATDASGQLAWREEYEPYGFKRLTPTEAEDQRLWYTGHAHDEAMSLSYFGARWYDPEAGRFLAVDPVYWIEDSPVHSFNRYAYANNNPYKYIDPDGELPVFAVFIVKELVTLAIEHTTGVSVPISVGGAAKTLGRKAARDAAEQAAKISAAKRGKNFDQARREGFENAGMIDPSKVQFSKVDKTTGTVVEFKGPGGAKVGYDGPHKSPGPHHDTQHISWQSAGKRGSGGAKRGNIPYDGPRHPSRPDRKNQ